MRRNCRYRPCDDVCNKASSCYGQVPNFGNKREKLLLPKNRKFGGGLNYERCSSLSSSSSDIIPPPPPPLPENCISGKICAISPSGALNGEAGCASDSNNNKPINQTQSSTFKMWKVKPTDLKRPSHQSSSPSSSKFATLSKVVSYRRSSSSPKVRTSLSSLSDAPEPESKKKADGNGNKNGGSTKTRLRNVSARLIVASAKAILRKKVSGMKPSTSYSSFSSSQDGSGPRPEEVESEKVDDDCNYSFSFNVAMGELERRLDQAISSKGAVSTSTRCSMGTESPPEDDKNDMFSSGSFLVQAFAFGLLAALIGNTSQSKEEKEEEAARAAKLLEEGETMGELVGDLFPVDENDQGCILDDLEVDVEALMQLVADDAESDCLSIPSLSPEGSEDCNVGFSNEDFLPASSAARSQDSNFAGSAIAWGAMAALLGSPAPSSIVECKKKKERSVINLWEVDGEETDMISLSSEPNDEVVDKESDENSLPSIVSGEEIPDLDEQSIPSLSPETENDLDSAPIYENVADFVSAPPAPSSKSDEGLTGSAIAWSALAALLNSASPSAVMKRERSVVDLWKDGEDETDMVSLPCDEDDKHITESADVDDHSVPSIVSETPDACDGTLELENLVNSSHPPCFNDFGDTTTPQKSNGDDITGSAMAMSALAALFSHVPSTIVKKERSVVNLWEEKDGDTDLISLPSEDLPVDNCDSSAVVGASSHSDDYDVDEISMPSLHCEEAKNDQDNHSIPSIITASQDEAIHYESLSPMSSTIRSPLASPSRMQQNDKELTGSVIAWSALAAFDFVLSPKQKDRRNSAKNLWEDVGTHECEPPELSLISNDSSSSNDDSFLYNSIPGNSSSSFEKSEEDSVHIQISDPSNKNKVQSIISIWESKV